MTTFLNALKWPPRILLYISYAAILVMLGMTVWDVFMRYVFNKPTTGVGEVSQMLLVISMTCLAQALLEGRYVAVGVLVDRFPKKINFAIEIIMGIIAIVFFAIVGWELLLMTEVSYNLGELYLIIKTPRWPFYIFLGVAFISCILATIVYVYDRIKNYIPPGEANFFDENPDLAILAFDDDDHKISKGGAE